MTCVDCVTWTTFAIVAGIALAFLITAIAFVRLLRRRSPLLRWAVFIVMLIPAAYFVVAAWRMLFGPNWHGHLLP